MRRALLLLALGASTLEGQNTLWTGNLTRATAASGLADSIMVLVTDSANAWLRSATLKELRKVLATRAFDSVVTAGPLRLTGATVYGAPTWNATQAFAAGQLTDSATGAARSATLTTARTVWGQSFNGSANISGDQTATATNDNAAAGKIGEYSSHATVSGGAVTLTTNTTANVDSLSLTAGDWDVTGVVDFIFAATTSYTNLIGGLSTTSATIGAQDANFDHETAANVPTATKNIGKVLPVVRFSLSATTKVYLIAQGTFTVSTLKAYGTIRARRVR